MTPTEFHPAADREARRRYARRASAATAARFHAELWRAVTAVSRTPTAFPPHLFGTRFHHLRKFSYHLVYSIEPGLVSIVAVAHDCQRPGYWSRRLPRP